jgi:5-methylcytosine-specific restriction endonuclease McrA
MFTWESAASGTPGIRSARERSAVTPLAPARYKLQMTLGADTVEKLRRAQDLLRHAIPDGDPAAILDRALTLLLAQVTRTKLAATKRPRITLPESHRRSRYVPASVRRAVWARDEGRCTFTGPEGRCGETAFIELHHLEPYALGGATTVEGIALRCRAHNVYEADREFRVLENAVSLDRLL